MDLIKLTLQFMVLFGLLVIYIVLMERGEKSKSWALRLKRTSIVVCAGVGLSKYGRSLLFLIVVILVSIIALVKDKKVNNDVHMGS